MNRIGQTILFSALIILMTACGDSVASLNNEGNAQFEDKNYTEALDKYLEAQRENPDLPEPYYNAGNAHHREGNFESAATQTQQSIRTSEGELAENSFYNLGNTYFKIEDWQAAIDAYKEALKLNPDDEQAKYNLELALKKQQQQQQQQQQQGSGDQPPQDQDQSGGQQNQQQQDQGQNGDQEQEDQQQGGGQPEPDEQGQSEGQQQDQQQQAGPRGLTPQEAEQLLDALGQDSQTLRERLQQGFFAPGLPPTNDW